MHIAAGVRLFLARRPWVYWLVVAVLAGAVAFGVEQRMSAVDEARRQWSSWRTVVVATHDHRPGDELVGAPVELPAAAIPPGAVDVVPPGARATQRIGTGEIVVDVDVSPGDGPAAAAAVGTIVVPVTDPLALGGVSIGQSLRVVADGVVLAERAAVVEIVDEVVFVAVPADDAPAVAAAAQQHTISLLFLP